MIESPVRSVNRVPLEYWKLRGYNTQDVDAICQGLDRAHVARIQILPGLDFRITISHRIAETHQGHFPAIATLIKDLLKEWTGPDPVGELLFWLEDGQWTDYWGKRAPVIAFAKPVNDNYTFLMPDPAFLGANGYQEERIEIADIENTLSWKKKLPNIFWRGVNSGTISLGNDWRKAPRVQLALKSKQIADLDVIDAYFSHVVKMGDTNSHEVILFEDLVREKIPFSEFLKHRYLVDVDGENCAWRSFFLKLSTKSVVMKVDSPMMQWYYPDLVPWIHYVPIASDLSDLLEIREYLERAPQKASFIAERASKLMQQIRLEQEKAELLNLLKEILSCYRL